METTKIVPPIVLFDDEGVNIYGSVEEVEMALEAWAVDERPKWTGIDAQFKVLSLDKVPLKRKFLWFVIQGERVKLRLYPEGSFEAILTDKQEQMIDYLLRTSGENAETLACLSPKEMLVRVLKTAAELRKG